MLATAVLCLGLQALPEDWRLALRYEPGAVLSGQWWRLWTAQLVHLGWVHAVLNLAGLALIRGLVGRAMDALTALAVAACSLGGPVSACSFSPPRWPGTWACPGPFTVSSPVAPAP